jgi:RNA polymerase sigma factor (sigma-70 family)
MQDGASGNPASDEELASAIAKREQSEQSMRAAKDACSELFARHARKLLAFLAARVQRSDLEDIHQGVWERVWQHLPSGFRGGNFRAWLHQVARNYIIDLGRKKRADLLNGGEELPDERRGRPDERLLEEERAIALGRCLERLETSAATIVRARLSGESYEDICPRLGLKTAQAHKLFHQAKEQLRLCVERALA